MKKISVLLVFVMLLNLFVLPVSAANLTNLFTTSTLAWGNWSSSLGNLLDGDSTTTTTMGVHTAASNGRFSFKVSDDGSVKYNKMKVDVTRFNTSALSIKTSGTLNGTEPTATGKSSINLSSATTRYTYTPSTAVSTTATTVTMSFDTTSDKYIQLESTVSDSSADGFTASAVYLYYAVPASLKIDTTIPNYVYGTARTITPTASILDADGDVIKDTNMNTVTWSLGTGTQGVTIDGATGKITISADAPVQTVTVNAISNFDGDITASKTFKITPPALTNLLSSSTLVWSNWAAASVTNVLDSDATTYVTMGTHTVGSNGTMTFKVSDDGSVKYNKFKADVKIFNTSQAVIRADNSLTDAEPTVSGKSTVTLVDKTTIASVIPSTEVSTTAGTIVMSFDSTTDKYLQFVTTVADGSATGFQATKMYLYYAEPAAVSISSTMPSLEYGTGGTFTVNAKVTDVDGDTLNDSTLNAVKWSVNSSASGVSIDSETGMVTVSEDAPVQTVTVTAKLASNNKLSASKTFKITSPAMDNLISSSTVVWSPWSGNLTANLVDGDETTFYNAGEHTAGSTGRVLFKVSDDGSVKYNKVKFYVTRFNSTGYKFSSSDTLNGTEPTTNTTSSVNISDAVSLGSETLDVARTEVTTETVTMPLITSNDKYLRFENTVAEGSPTYGIRITEFELYYSTPLKITPSLSKTRILAGYADTINASATVTDAQGDKIIAADESAVTWSINSDAEGVTIDSSTGVITVSEDAPIQDVTVTATSALTGYSSVKGTKTLKISDTLLPPFAEQVKSGNIFDLTFDITQDNNLVAASLNFSAKEAYDTPYKVILALYDAEGKLISIKINEQDLVNKGCTLTRASAPMSSAYKTAKAYAWDDNMTPLSKVQTHTIKTLNSIKILSIGNSFSDDSTRHLWGILNGMGIDEVIVGNLTIGGCSLEKHWTNASNNNASYSYLKFTKDTTGTKTASVTMKSALTDEDWDFISLQQQSAATGDASTYEPYLTNLCNYINSNKTNSSAKLIWHMTWAYQADSTNAQFAQFNNNQKTMYNAIVSATKSKVVPNSKISIIFPTGTAIQNVRSSFIGDTITRDGYHMSYITGRYIAGMMWARMITGLSIDNITYVPGSEITAHKLNVIKRAVNAAAETPFAVTKIGIGKDNGFTQN